MDDGYLSDIWTFYFHDPYDKNWNLSSYIRICDISHVNALHELNRRVGQNIQHGMFFLSRENVFPCWDDPGNINGGTLSFKILKSHVFDFWDLLSHKTLQDCITKEGCVYDFDMITGISVSPKKNYCIIKIWLKNLDITNADNLDLDNKMKCGCLFQANKEKISECQ